MVLVVQQVDDIGLEYPQKHGTSGDVLKPEVKPEAFSTDPRLAALIEVWPRLASNEKDKIWEIANLIL
jgi:hypothetical protein